MGKVNQEERKRFVEVDMGKQEQKHMWGSAIFYMQMSMVSDLNARV